MREGRPSLTAVVVACARGVAALDPVAEQLVPAPVGALVRAARRAAGSRGPTGIRGRLVSAASFGLVEHLASRTSAIDEVVGREAEEGTRQVVVLGAGLDARAWRLRSLSESTLFEVDHPSTQAFKQRRLARWGTPSIAAVRFVGVDFERDDLEARIEDAGHDRNAPTTWIWEGVTVYLAPEAIRATLDIVARRSSVGSVLLMTYGTPELTMGPRLLRPLVPPVFAALGEPLRGLLGQAEARALVEGAGFSLERDILCVDPRGALGPRFTIAERLVVARRLR